MQKRRRTRTYWFAIHNDERSTVGNPDSRECDLRKTLVKILRPATRDRADYQGWAAANQVNDPKSRLRMRGRNLQARMKCLQQDLIVQTTRQGSSEAIVAH